MTKAVIFDVDGTLPDSVDRHARASQEALRKFGHDVPFDAVRQQIGKGWRPAFAGFLTKSEILEHGSDLEE
jgi:phosphoglycolate phosphatase-like HAD superfamily hydrolase